MNTIAMAHTRPAVRLVLGFLAGVLAVLTFHQATLAVLTSLGALSTNVYSMRPVAPLGVPQIVSSAFWGGVWGIVFAVFAAQFRRGAYWAFAIGLGAIALPLVGWFIVAPLKGQPMAAGWVPTRM